MSRKIFSHENSFRGLHEAIEAVLEDSDDDREYDLAIIPPNPSVVTDEEEQSDEDKVTSTLPRDVAGNVEVIVRDEGVLSSDYGSSDEEPLAAKRVRRQPNFQQQQQPPDWVKRSTSYTFDHQHTSEVQDKQDAIKKQLEDLNPIQIFETILDSDVLELIQFHFYFKITIKGWEEWMSLISPYHYTYRIGIHGKKWWWVLFTYMLDMAVSNTWRLHVLSKDDPMDQLLFRRSIARYYLRQETLKRDRPSSSRWIRPLPTEA
ncbi:hypothetical protein JYU34_008175 [Plutella xylostella]|uniref:PiggyBac transposable element-derived protein domain-containing protein n=1 Tax=Plutella xylostella TaxID=51655 RepID=A0ABQ7QNW7_PLUXY|nr:hypothetical protein JYU34_008175 [Plutella xylostella]